MAPRFAPGPGATDLFLGLTPDAVLAAVEASGLRCTPLCWPLNSYENRVFEIELADEARTRLVVKAYRPQRWTREQILEEHAFLADLHEAEVPVVPALPFGDGATLHAIHVPGGADCVWFCLFPRFGGRAPEEVDDARAARLGALCARIHAVGARRPAVHRLRLDGARHHRNSLNVLMDSVHVPRAVRQRLQAAGRDLCDLADDWLTGVPVQRIHGDFHLGNLIERDGVLHALDFDDFVMGPPVQDLWLLLPGRDPDTLRRREIFLQAYEQFRDFDRATLRLVEPLRGLRLLHFAAWLAARWHDPIFPQTWPQFTTEAFWQETTDALEECLDLAHVQPAQVDAAPLPPAEDEASNADFFWDWKDR